MPAQGIDLSKVNTMGHCSVKWVGTQGREKRGRGAVGRGISPAAKLG